MATQTATFRGTRAELQSLLALAVAVYCGRVADPTGLANGLQLLLGVEALSIIKDAFVAKARGGVDAAGDSWLPLQRETVAYGRRHPGLNAKRKAAVAQGRGGRPLLTAAQDKRWRQLYGRRLYRLARSAQLPVTAAPTTAMKGAAAAYAWFVIKSEGGKTVLGEYGGTRVEILRDTGQLLASLSPGVSGPSGHPDQVLRTEPGAVIVGTNRKGAGAHHEGKGNVPQRRLWPEESRWPAAWWDRIAEKGKQGLTKIVVALLRLRPGRGGTP